MNTADRRALPSGPVLPTGQALLPILVAVSYLVVGVAFFLDPSQSAVTGSDEYWTILAEESFGRQVFLLGFAMTGLFAMGATGTIRALLRPGRAGWLQFAFILGYLGYGVTAVSYVRILSGEATRARAFEAGDGATRDAIASFSIGLDPDGWLMFGATGLFLAAVNLVAGKRRVLPAWLAALGLVIAGLSLLAWLGLVTDRSQLVNIAVGVGGIGLGPIWWAGLGLFVHRARGRQLPPLEGDDVVEPHG